MLDFYLGKTKDDQNLRGPVARVDDEVHAALFGSTWVSDDMRILLGMRDLYRDVAVRPSECRVLLKELGQLEEVCDDARVLLFARRLSDACQSAIAKQLSIFGFAD